MSATTLSAEEEQRLNAVARALRTVLNRELNVDGFNVMVGAMGGHAYECDVPSDVSLPADGIAVLSGGVSERGWRIELNGMTPEPRKLRFTVRKD